MWEKNVKEEEKNVKEEEERRSGGASGRVVRLCSICYNQLWKID